VVIVVVGVGVGIQGWAARRGASESGRVRACELIVDWSDEAWVLSAVEKEDAWLLSSAENDDACGAVVGKGKVG
jgi:hypothetical protein